MAALLWALLMAHPTQSWEEKVFAADYALEVRLADRAVTRVLFPPGDPAPTLPEKLFAFVPGSKCGQAVTPTTRAVLFFRRGADGGGLEQLGGSEQEKGPWTSLHPAFERFAAAVAQAKTWSEERMRAVPDELLWQQQRAALAQAENPSLAYFAARFLERHDSGAVVDAAWGAPGTAGRKAKEQWAKAPLDGAACP